MSCVLVLCIHWALFLSVQVVYNTSLHKMLDSYLRYGPRPHEATPPVSLRGCELLTSVHRRVFMTFLRMSTHKESSVRDCSVTTCISPCIRSCMINLPSSPDSPSFRTIIRRLTFSAGGSKVKHIIAWKEGEPGEKAMINLIHKS